MPRLNRLIAAAAALVIAAPLMSASIAHAAPAKAKPKANPWLKTRVLDMPHAGGEIEFPGNTMYAFKRAVKLGGDMLELDVQSTKDNQLVVLHNGTVDSNTNGTGSISDLTLAQVKQLDAAYWFLPGQGTTHSASDTPEAYTFRGVRTGEVAPPKGYKASDFTIPTLAQVFKQFPKLPINIEIKGLSDDNLASFEHNADLLAALLKKTHRTNVIVVSFNDDVLSYFHKLMPKIGLAPGLDSMMSYFLADVKPIEGTVALQVPPSYKGFQVVTPAFVKKAHKDGYAVDVWFDPGYGADDKPTYEAMIADGVDGLMAGRPSLLEKIFKQKHIKHP